MKNSWFTAVFFGITILLISCNSSTVKEDPSPTNAKKSGLLEEVSSHFGDKNIVLYYTESKDWEKLRAELLKEKERIETEKGIEIKDLGSGLYCYSTKSLPDLKDDPTLFKEIDNQYLLCGLDNPWGALKFSYAGVHINHPSLNGNWIESTKQDPETGEWEKGTWEETEEESGD